MRMENRLIFAPFQESFANALFILASKYSWFHLRYAQSTRTSFETTVYIDSAYDLVRQHSGVHHEVS